MKILENINKKYKCILGTYSNTSILYDDFYHIINKHRNEIDFDIIYDIMII